MEDRHSHIQTLVLVLVAGLLFFTRLDCALQEPEEPRYAEIPRQMLEHGQFTVPYYHGLPYYDKPPLLYWLVMGCYGLFGIHDWAAKLVPSSAGFLTVLVTYLWGRNVAGQRAGFAGAMMLCLSGRFIYLGRLLTMNSLLCLCVTATLAAAHLAVRGPRLDWRWWFVSAVACAFGMLSKGPVALVLVLVPLLAFQCLDRMTVRPRIVPWLVYLGLSAGLAVPWYLRAALAERGFLDYFFLKHNLLRYFSPFDHAKPIWFYLPELLLGMLPWSILLLPLVKHLAMRAKQPEERRPGLPGLSLPAFAWCFLFFSLSGSKRSGYILPAMPLLALSLGSYLDSAIALAGKFIDERKSVARWSWCGAMVFCALFLAVVAGLPGHAGKFSMRGQLLAATAAARDLQVPVICYPRRWDSVSFYLKRDDIRVYTRTEEQQLFADLRMTPKTLAFVKSEHFLNEFLEGLPRSLEFVPLGRTGQVALGWVQGRRSAPSSQAAGRVD